MKFILFSLPLEDQDLVYTENREESSAFMQASRSLTLSQGILSQLSNFLRYLKVPQARV